MIEGRSVDVREPAVLVQHCSRCRVSAQLAAFLLVTYLVLYFEKLAFDCFGTVFDFKDCPILIVHRYAGDQG
jgi:hypothetical protein